MNVPVCPNCGKRLVRGGIAGSGRVRWQCRDGGGERKYCYSSTNPAAGKRTRSGDAGSVLKFRRDLGNSKVFVITSAQNATPVQPVFWNILKRIKEDRSAQLLAIPFRYKNPSSTWTASQANEERWAEEVQPYLWNVTKTLNSNLMIMGDAKIIPTASDPLTGFDPLSGTSSAIIGHPKIALRSISTPSNRMAKVMVTTGACTLPNFTDSRLGKLGKFHHTLAAIIVEIEGSKFYLRHLYFDSATQSVTDLNIRYYEDRTELAPRPLALIMGDTHVDFIDPAVERATFGEDGMVEVLNPLHLIYHDLLDSYSCNPHHRGNPFIAYAKAISGMNDVKAEVRRACEFVRERTKKDRISVIVPSNHDDMFKRWIITEDWKTQGKNMKFYISTADRMLAGTRMTEHGTQFPSPLPLVFPDFVDMRGIKVLKEDESFVLGRVELGMHGDRGPSGARGSIKNLRRIGIRSIIGHSHSPGIDEGCVQVGTSTRLRLEYNSGPGAWLNAHCILHEGGKRQLVIIVDGKWRGRVKNRRIKGRRVRR